MVFLYIDGLGYSLQLFNQILTMVLLWRYSVDVTDVHDQMTLREIILDNLSGPDPIS